MVYLNNIPQPSDDLSDSQGEILGNFMQLDTSFGVDHYKFSDLTGKTGQHQQITFPLNNVPSVPTSPPVLFTNTVAGIPQLFFYSGSAAQSSSQYVVGGNGSTFLLGGIILKWFSGTVNGNTPFTFTALGINNFPNNAWQAFLGKADTTHNIGFTALGTSGITITTATSGAFTVSVLVIGN